jgi:plasmid stabilization system protein ParE
MARVIWSRHALLDLSRLHGFLDAKSPDAARRAIAAIRQGVKVLGDHPAAGRPAFDVRHDVRDLPIFFGSAGYIIRYRASERDVLIASIRHMREAGF